MTDDDWKKVSDHAKELDVIETALNKADVPVDVSLFTSEKVGQPYNMASRVLWLIGDRNKSTAERDQLRRMHDGVSADLDRERREHQEAMAEAAARELKLTEERDELSARYNRAADDLQAAVEQAEHDAHKLLDADELMMENLRLERLVKQLTGKVKRREADIERYRAELAKKPAKKPKAAAKRGRRKS